MTIIGTSGDDTLTGTSGNDTFALQQGGSDTVSALGGNDIFSMKGALNAGDALDGGAGNDTVLLAGDYTGENAVTLAPTTLANVESIRFGAGFSYDLTSDDATVAAGATFGVNGSALGAGDVLAFNGAAETDGKFSFEGGAGNDVLTGGAGNDVFNLSHGGNDTASGGGGNNTFNMGGALNAGDMIDGGSGSDTIVLTGMGDTDTLTLGPTTLTSVENMTLKLGHDYDIVMDDGNVADGGNLKIDASSLRSTDSFTFDGSAETTGGFSIFAGKGTVHLTGGAGDDGFSFGPYFTDQDSVDGGDGIDHLVLNGNYVGQHELNVGADAFAGIQVIFLHEGNRYRITTADGAFGAPSTLPVTFTCYNFGAADGFTFNGSAETSIRERIFAGAGTYNLKFGHTDDLFAWGGAWGDQDNINGGGGNDTLALNADFLHPELNANYTGANALDFTAGQLRSIEMIGLTNGYSYDITMNDGNVGAGQTLTFLADSYTTYNGGSHNNNVHALGAADAFTLDGSAETDGHFVVDAGAGAYNLTGGQLSDSFNFGGTLVATDHINGGGGADTVTLDGNYAGRHALVLSDAAFTLQNIGTLMLDGGFSYSITTADNTVAIGATFTVNASGLGAGDTLDFDSTASGPVVVIAGAGTNVIAGGTGADDFTAGGIGDRFNYNNANDSTGPLYDTIHNLDLGIATFAVAHNVTAIGTAVTTGALDAGANFDAELGSAVGAGQLGARGAVLFTADSGDLSGHTFLIVNQDGVAGYQGGGDVVIDVTGFTGTLTTANFT